jgi:hypothetical protein
MMLMIVDEFVLMRWWLCCVDHCVDDCTYVLTWRAGVLKTSTVLMRRCVDVMSVDGCVDDCCWRIECVDDCVDD